MDDLERVERERYGIFTLCALFAFVGLVASGRHWLLASLLAVGVGLLASGSYVARRTTSASLWPLVEGEARLHGRVPSRRGVWLGNVVPALAALAGAAWFGRGA